MHMVDNLLMMVTQRHVDLNLHGERNYGCWYKCKRYLCKIFKLYNEIINVGGREKQTLMMDALL